MTAAATYRAFISYSRADIAVARRLQGLVETYRVPPTLVADGAPARLYPVFRDQSDMVVGADLSEIIRAALLASDALIVICSPAAAASRYVDLEIRTFTAAHPDRPVLAVIVAGDPKGGTDGCFPPALLTEGREPLAADLRPGGDGWRTTRLKLIAALLGVNINQLARRDEQRRVRRLRLYVALALAGMLILGALLAQALLARREADRQRVSAEEMGEFMVVDLRRELEPIGRLSILDAVGARVLDYYQHQDVASLGPTSLARRARVLRMMGEVHTRQGNLGAALRFFRAAADSTGRLLERAPRDGERIFDHAQSVFYIGNVAFQQRRLDTAQAAFDEYRALAERLVQLDPKRADWQAESGYAYSNLGTVLLDRGRNGDAEAAFRRALIVSETAANGAPANSQAQTDLAQAHAWLADALSRRGRLREALTQRDAESAIYQALRAGHRDDTRFAYMSTNSAVSRARLLADLGSFARARAAITEAISLLEQLRVQDPSNVEWTETLLTAELTREEMAGPIGKSSDVVRRFDALLSAMPATAYRGRTSRMLAARVPVIAAARANIDENPALALDNGQRALARLSLVKPADAWDVVLVRTQARYEIVMALVKLRRRAEAEVIGRSLMAEVRRFSPDDWKLNKLARQTELLIDRR